MRPEAAPTAGIWGAATPPLVPGQLSGRRLSNSTIGNYVFDTRLTLQAGTGRTATHQEHQPCVTPYGRLRAGAPQATNMRRLAAPAVGRAWQLSGSLMGKSQETRRASSSNNMCEAHRIILRHES